VDQLKAALAADHSADAWYASITDMTLETHLGAPVLVVGVNWDELTVDFNAKQATLDALNAALDGYDTNLAINVATRDVNGAFQAVGGGGSGVGMLADVVALPPAPTTPEELSAWLTTVFGPGGLMPLGPDETWLSSITSIAMQDEGNGPIMTVTTSLGSADKSELANLTAAEQLANTPLLSLWGLRGAGDYYSANGGGGCGNGPGSCGWFYPLPQ
jgi:hypothetical protein